jgi:hypothetical protein
MYFQNSGFGFAEPFLPNIIKKGKQGYRAEVCDLCGYVECYVIKN